MTLRMGRGFGVLLLLAIGAAVLALTFCQPKPAQPPPAGTQPAPPVEPVEIDCAGPAEMAAAAAQNGHMLSRLTWSPFGPEELGWEAYAPQVGREIASACPPSTPGFAAALAAWQARHGVAADGRMGEPTFTALKAAWHRRRPLRGKLPVDNCPPPPPAGALQAATAEEGYGGKVVSLTPPVLDAWRRMRAAAMAEDPAIARDPKSLVLVSGFRDPAADAARCAIEQNCDNRRRAICSGHRTGLVLDLYVGMAPGSDPTSTAHHNRLHQSRTPAYRWLVANAERFGFVNYIYEPWHWEWNGRMQGTSGQPAP